MPLPFVEPHVSVGDYEPERRRKLLRFVGRTFGPSVHWHEAWNPLRVHMEFDPSRRGGMDPEAVTAFRDAQEMLRQQSHSDRLKALESQYPMEEGLPDPTEELKAENKRRAFNLAWWENFTQAMAFTTFATLILMAAGAGLTAIPPGYWWSDLLLFGGSLAVPVILGVVVGSVHATSEVPQAKGKRRVR